MAGNEGNGKKVLMWAIAMLLGGLSGATGMGMYMGGISSHIDNQDIHVTAADRADETRTLIDREIWPLFEHVQKQLDRIENKLDTHMEGSDE